jgi:hypothetical protein
MLDTNNESKKNIKFYDTIIYNIVDDCYINRQCTKLIVDMIINYEIRLCTLMNLILDSKTISNQLFNDHDNVLEKTIIKSQWISHKTIDYELSYESLNVIWFLEHVRLTNKEIASIINNSFDFLPTCNSCYAQKLNHNMIQEIVNLNDRTEFMTSIRTKSNLISYSTLDTKEYNKFVINARLHSTDLHTFREDREYLSSKYCAEDIDSFINLYSKYEYDKFLFIHYITSDLSKLNNVDINELVVDKLLEKYENNECPRITFISRIIDYGVKVKEETIFDIISELNSTSIYSTRGNMQYSLNAVEYFMNNKIKFNKKIMFPTLIRNDVVNEDIITDSEMTDDLWKILQIHHYKYNVSLLAKGKYCITYDAVLKRINEYEFVEKHFTFGDDIMDAIISFI